MTRGLRGLIPRRVAMQLAAVIILAVVVLQLVVSLSFRLLHDDRDGHHRFIHAGTVVRLLAAETAEIGRAHV